MSVFLKVREDVPLNSFASDRELVYFKLNGFWHSMDTLREKNFLEKLWNQGNAYWKNW